jgi:hypothetical protein
MLSKLETHRRSARSLQPDRRHKPPRSALHALATRRVHPASPAWALKQEGESRRSYLSIVPSRIRSNQPKISRLKFSTRQNLRRFASVDETGVRSRNPERSAAGEGSLSNPTRIGVPFAFTERSERVPCESEGSERRESRDISPSRRPVRRFADPYDFFNRQFQRLEPALTHGKQRIALPSNRQFFAPTGSSGDRAKFQKTEIPRSYLSAKIDHVQSNFIHGDPASA